MSELNKNILIIAHRGASNVAPENTLKSFKKAIELGADYVEFDVHFSKDEEIIIMHDENTLRTTGREGLIKEMTLKELKRLDAGESEKIPTLDELIDVAKGKIRLQLEIKASGMAEKIVETLENSGLIESTLISSFNHSELLNIKQIEPRLKLAPLIIGVRQNKTIEEAVLNKYYAIHPFYKLINKKFIDLAHKNNIKINAYTVDSKNAIVKLINMGIDGIITNKIDLVKKILNRD